MNIPQIHARIRYLMIYINHLEQLMAAAQAEIDGLNSRMWEHEYDEEHEQDDADYWKN